MQQHIPTPIRNTPTAPPPRLLSDVRIRKTDDAPAPWLGRRQNKMRERFPAGDAHEPVEGAALIAPVQPSPAKPLGLPDMLMRG